MLAACRHEAPLRARADEPVAVAPSTLAPPSASHPAVSTPAGTASAGADAASAGSPSAPRSDEPRLYVKSRFVFVRPRPDANADYLGFLWFGAAVKLRSTTPVCGVGCAAFYAIEPEGYVCVDEKQATLNPTDPEFVAVSQFAPKLDRASPHRYAQSNGAELVRAVAGGEPEISGLPALFHEPRGRTLPFSTVAYADERTMNGEDWLLTADLLWLKKSAVTPYPEITFHGVELGTAYHLPLAFFRQASSRKYRRGESGKLARSADVFALHSLSQLDAESVIERGQRFFRVSGTDDWVRESDAVLPAPRGLTPWGARVGAVDHTGLAPKNATQSWIEVSVLGGWLIAYEGTRAVYATMISPGRGGIPQAGKDTLEIAATPLGTWPISGKIATVTMESPGENVHADVPWTQNFQKPYAIHTAYWHDDWGNPESGGCINVSPIDGKWLFDFSEPRLPPGWHSVRWQPARGAPTLLVVHE